jgi:2-haloacid dehalogenase
MAAMRALVPSGRREFLGRVAASGLLLQGSANRAAGSRSRVKAIAFDGFPILDPRPVFALVDEFFPEKGGELANLWRARQFEYTWLRTLTRRYVDFRRVTEDALVFAGIALRLDLTAEKRDRLMATYFNLRCWPEVAAAIGSLRKAGIRLAFLSNMTAGMLEAGIRNSHLDGMFEHVLSTDRVGVYKPDPRAYQMGVDAFGVPPEQIVFAAFAGWDVAGARSFGYPTFWVNRQNQPTEQLGVVADAGGRTLDDLVEWLL